MMNTMKYDAKTRTPYKFILFNTNYLKSFFLSQNVLNKLIFFKIFFVSIFFFIHFTDII